jgi:multidrug efflux pump subunit AcrA (membrane-fusion protein)
LALALDGEELAVNSSLNPIAFADLPNTDGILRPGVYATARIPVSRPETLTLPSSTVRKSRSDPRGYPLQP